MVELHREGVRKNARVFSVWMALLGIIGAAMPLALQEWSLLGLSAMPAGLLLAAAAAFGARGATPVTSGLSRATSLAALLAAAWLAGHSYLFSARAGYRYAQTAIGILLVGLAALDLWNSGREGRKPRGRATHR
jgi:hypothetical protein